MDPEHAPLTQPMLPHREGVERKQLNEYLRPLERFLDKSVGRKWNDVYAEIRAAVPSQSAVQAHVYQHVGWFVEKVVTIEHGEVFVPTKSSPLRQYGYYVHPTRGTLEKMPKPDWQKSRPKGNPTWISSTEIALRRNGKWYAVKVAPNSESESDAWYTPSEIERARWGNSDHQYLMGRYARATYGDGELRAVSVRDLGKRELKKVA